MSKKKKKLRKRILELEDTCASYREDIYNITQKPESVEALAAVIRWGISFGIESLVFAGDGTSKPRGLFRQIESNENN